MIRNRPVVLTIAALLVVAGALVLRKSIYETVIIPLAYLGWLLGLYYQLIPQIFLWVVLILLTLITAVRTLLTALPLGKRTIIAHKIPKGPIERLSSLLDKRPRGMYYKWMIANRLGRLARELLDQREGVRTTRFSRFVDRAWEPPNEVRAYLESGLNGSFADYPRARWSRVRPTPLDEHPQRVVEYLESEMEMGRNGHR